MTTLPDPVLTPFPSEEAGAPWPTTSFERAAAPEGAELDALLDAVMDPEGPIRTTYAALVLLGGRIVGERYGGALPSFTHEPTPVVPSTPLLSWSMAKSMLAVIVGTLVDRGELDLDDPANVPEWREPGDPRGAITLRNLLEMRDGLDFVEDYTDERASDVIEMLFGAGQADMAHFAADRPVAAEPGTRFNYSSGTTNIIARLVGDHLGGPEAMRAFLDKELFGPLDMRTATPTFDDAGTFIASSYVHATAEDFARFGLLMLRGGIANGRRIVSESWMNYQRTPRSIDPEDGDLYSAQFWVTDDGRGTYSAHGYEGQRIIAAPALDLVIVRLGSTPADRSEHLRAWEDAVLDAVAGATS
jgi:CubicO group peptidase (beta-lactamase class C family)